MTFRTVPRLAFLTCLLAFLVQPARVVRAADNGSGNGAEPFPSATPERVVDVTKAIFPAVVRLDVAQETYSQGKRTVSRGIGSGVIIDGQGHILTNYHVAGRAAEIYVTLENKERVPAKLIGDDHWTDLAIVQLDMDTIKKKSIPFNFAPLGDSGKLLIGQDVMAIGTPFGLARTMTLGIVSNNERTFYPDDLDIDGYETGEFSNWIQMDTPISPGNSGGPLVDLGGKVVGINTRGSRAGQNLNFAVPIDIAKDVISKLLAKAETDKIVHVERSELGMDFKPLQDLESFYNLDINKGVLVNNVDKNSPASKAGVRTQDILLEMNGQQTNVRFPEELAPLKRRISDLPVGSDVSLKLKRGKEVISLNASTVKLESAQGEEKELKEWGVSVRDVTRRYANENNLDDDKGVVVTSLNPGYPAAKADLSEGDVIRSVNQKDAVDIDEFLKLYKQSVKQREPKVFVEFVRGRSRRSALLKIGYATPDPTPGATSRPGEPSTQPATQP